MNGAPALVQQTAGALEGLNPDDMAEMIRMLTLLPQYAAISQTQAAPRQPPVTFTANEAMWRQFYDRQLPDTTRIRLEQFHLFEYFPLSPGKYHTEDGEHFRHEARAMLEEGDDGVFYNPYGKVNMIKGGIGAVKLQARPLPGAYGREPHYLMTASATGVCHEGIPVLVPRRLYGQISARLRGDGAVPVLLEGEMKQLPDNARSFFDIYQLSNLPQLIIHVDHLEPLPQPRAAVTRYKVSIALSFYGEFEEQKGVYMSYCAFDPASQTDLRAKTDWLKQYVQKYQGEVIADFDEEWPEFRNASFALRRVMNGQLDPVKLQEMMNELGYAYFGGNEADVRRAVNEHNNYFLEMNVVGSRGVQVRGDVDGHIVTGDDNEVTG